MTYKLRIETYWGEEHVVEADGDDENDALESALGELDLDPSDLGAVDVLEEGGDE